jgi:hypothetical protein
VFNKLPHAFDIFIGEIYSFAHSKLVAFGSAFSNFTDHAISNIGFMAFL